MNPIRDLQRVRTSRVSAYLDGAAPFAFAGTQARALSDLPRRSEREAAQLVGELTQMREHVVRRLWLLAPEQPVACAALIDRVLAGPMQTLRGVPLALDVLEGVDRVIHPLCRQVHAAQEARALLLLAVSEGEWQAGLRLAARRVEGVANDPRWLAALTLPVVPVLTMETATVVPDLRDLRAAAPELAAELEALLSGAPLGLPVGVTSVQGAGAPLRATAEQWVTQVLLHYRALGGDAPGEALLRDLAQVTRRHCELYQGGLK